MTDHCNPIVDSREKLLNGSWFKVIQLLLLNLPDQVRREWNIGSNLYALFLQFTAIGTNCLAVLLGWLTEVVNIGDKVFGSKFIFSLAFGSEINLKIEWMTTHGKSVPFSW